MKTHAGKPHLKLRLSGAIEVLASRHFSREEARAQFNRIGMSVAAWSRKHHVSQSLTYQVLRGDKKGLRGQAHRIAVLLGIKDGVA